MRPGTHMIRNLVGLLSLALLLLGPDPAWAYLDPGSGSMLLQVLLGGVAGAVVLLRLYWRRLLVALGLRKDDGGGADGEAAAGRENAEPKSD